MARPAQRLVLALLLIVGGVAATGWWWARGVAGAGALHQYAPATVKAGAPFEIKVLAGVWGAGREAPQRYSDWLLQLQQGGQPLGLPMAPSRTGHEGGRVALYFELRAPSSPAGRGAALTWELRFNFDGQAHQIPGSHPIELATNSSIGELAGSRLDDEIQRLQNPNAKRNLQLLRDSAREDIRARWA